MISNSYHGVAGSTAPQKSAGAGGVRQVQGKSPVEVSTPAPAPEAGRQAGSTAAVDAQNLKSVIEDLNSMAQTVQRQLSFSVDEDSGKTVIKVIDTETDEVIRQIPPEDIMEMQKHMGEMNGLLFRTSA